MKKKRIRLTEEQLCNIVRESVYNMLIDDNDNRRGGGNGKEPFSKKFARKAPQIGRLAGTLAATKDVGNIFGWLGHAASSFFSE